MTSSSQDRKIDSSTRLRDGFTRSSAGAGRDYREARGPAESELRSSTVRIGANVASETETGSDGDTVSDVVRCPCEAQGAIEVMTLQDPAGATVLLESLWTIDQVAVYLKIPVQTLRTWRKNKTGPKAARIGKHLRYDPRQVRRWVEQRTVEAADD